MAQLAIFFLALPVCWLLSGPLVDIAVMLGPAIRRSLGLE